tara:strand:- start:1678 stop:2568 length:891 start_codon:yes stop_codon:yes gene_type:complete
MVGAIVGAVSGLAQAGFNFYQANKQDQAAKAAAQKSQELFKQARSKAEIDYFAGLTLPMDAYNQAYEQNLAGQKLAVEGLQEADTRFLAGGVGRIGAQATAANEAVRDTQGEQLYNLDMLKRQSRDAINNRLIGMDLDQATGEAQRERDQQELRANAIQNAFSGVNQAATSAAELVPLYNKNMTSKEKAEKKAARGKGRDAILEDRDNRIEARRTKGLDEEQIAILNNPANPFPDTPPQFNFSTPLDNPYQQSQGYLGLPQGNITAPGFSSYGLNAGGVNSFTNPYQQSQGYLGLG